LSDQKFFSSVIVFFFVTLKAEIQVRKFELCLIKLAYNYE